MSSFPTPHEFTIEHLKSQFSGFGLVGLTKTKDQFIGITYLFTSAQLKLGSFKPKRTSILIANSVNFWITEI